jgi:PhnB protein
MALMPYVFFEGRCEEAIGFYQKAVGAEVMFLMRCKDAPPSPQGIKPGTENAILHASLRIAGTIVGMSDGMSNGKPEFKGFALTVEVKDKEEATRVFGGLAEGGQVQMPLGYTFFSPSFGMVTDRFGVLWMVMIPQPMQSPAGR